MPENNEPMPSMPQLAILDYIFPGVSASVHFIQRCLHIDLSLYIPTAMFIGALMVVWNYLYGYLWDQLVTYFMSSVDIRADDEIHTMVMAWVANQKFLKSTRHLVVNTNWNYDEDNDDIGEDSSLDTEAKENALSYTPSFGTHYFWYRGRVLLFKRNSIEQRNSFLTVSEREEISICCFGRNPSVLKELLNEARLLYRDMDHTRTIIYRGTTRPGLVEPTWQRCMARPSRPLSTVILNERIKNNLIDDLTDYLHPDTKLWYSNRGIPCRRGYLLHGPPGTGKSSLCFALAGHFKMSIYIVSLNSIAASEEGLMSLFADLPSRCLVLFEDIDTAGLTHTRGSDKDGHKLPSISAESNEFGHVISETGKTTQSALPGRLSLSGLLNILDGVASQEGRILFMTTNHLGKLDKALIRPGRVDMIVEFGRADGDMTAAIFRGIFGQLDGDGALKGRTASEATNMLLEPETLKGMALEFAAKIPSEEFSLAELQGHLLRHKENPQAAVDKAMEFVEETRRFNR